MNEELLVWLARNLGSWGGAIIVLWVLRDYLHIAVSFGRRRKRDQR